MDKFIVPIKTSKNTKNIKSEEKKLDTHVLKDDFINFYWNNSIREAKTNSDKIELILKSIL